MFTLLLLDTASSVPRNMTQERSSGATVYESQDRSVINLTPQEQDFPACEIDWENIALKWNSTKE